ncbi:hypothetical protein MTO96_005877 [Rhipicephalus appendiculatus]
MALQRPCRSPPVSATEGAAVTATAPEVAVLTKEGELPLAPSPIDIRRPSILKPRHSGAAVHAAADVRERRSTVDFGLHTPKGLVEGDPPKTSLLAVGATDGAPLEAAGAKSPIAPPSRKRRLSLAPGRFSSMSFITASPSGPFASASMTDSAFHGSDLAAQRKKQVSNFTTFLIAAS